MTYALLPFYKRYILTSRYTPLPNGIASDPSQAFSDLRDRVTSLLGRARSNSGIERYLGDEELEEGTLSGRPSEGRGGTGEWRLSRELEGGFMDDSDEEEEDEAGRIRRVLG